MNDEKDWRDDYAEVEVFVHAVYRHKIVLKIPEGSTGEDEALKIMKSEPIEHWCDKDNLEGWVDSPHLFSSQDDREEVEAACYKFT